ncbi:D-hexose-6-phosphate mutarotase [Colwellia sp. 12G3]|uniref:D-hexose-6-phosphate mutarotase n=1 Tax=Colwellia sp. 12G3 TaxID=2058299 RepID=UPI000C32D4CB|nr:D-hexose-6-phosphate mutarotase [Colwellia sp. 12G3]PKI16997.1 D-hexose-6-phosphate mutarotase [Colwellia sp. 12G3]
MTTILLNNDFAQVTSITLGQSNVAECLAGLSIYHAHCQAKISLYGGQVLSFKPTGHKDVLWLSEQAYYQSGKAIRGGIPLCWPWFGPNDKQTEEIKAASHGFARQLPWKVESVEANKSGVTVILVLAGENQHPLWPNAYKLTQTLFFGDSLKQSLAMSNLSQEDAQYSAALHSYFTVSNPSNVSIDALTGLSYSDNLTGNSSLQQQAVSCVGEIDRKYHSSEKVTLVDSQWQRKIDIVSRNCQQWVLWNPGVALANTMADIHPQGEQQYVCLEAANTHWQTLPAGETVTISQEISVTDL